MLTPGRTYSATNTYRYGFNGKENDNEVKGEGDQQDYEMRIYDPRLGRFLSVDPLIKKYPELTPYQFASNTPIQAIDLDGLEPVKPLPSNPLRPVGEPGKVVPLNPNNSENWFQRALRKTKELFDKYYPKDRPIMIPIPGVGVPMPVIVPTIKDDPDGNIGKKDPKGNPGTGVKKQPPGLPVVAPDPTQKPSPQPDPHKKRPSDDDDQDFASVRFQVQTGKLNVSSTTKINTIEIGVTKKQGYEALNKIYKDAITKDPSLAENKDFRSAIIKMSEKIKAIGGGMSKGVNRTTLQQQFEHKGKKYRVDLEIQRGDNFKTDK